MNTTLHVQLILSDEELTVLRRYLAEINAMLRESITVMERLQMELPCKAEWTEEEAVGMLFRTALDRERRVQMLQDGQTPPPWLEQLISESVRELRKEAGR